MGCDVFCRGFSPAWIRGFLLPSLLLLVACPHDPQSGGSATESGPDGDESTGGGDRGTDTAMDPSGDPGTSTADPGGTTGGTGAETTEPQGTSTGEQVESTTSGDDGTSGSSGTTSMTGEGGCGDGMVDDGEECDLGPMNADAEYGGCNEDCTWQPRCLDGSHQPGFEECDPSDPLFAEAAACNDSCMWDGGVVFVTSQAFKGNLGGQVGADQKCQELAAAAGLKMQYKAWLSVGDSHAPDHIPIADAKYYRLDGELVVSGKGELLGGKLQLGIDVTEQQEKQLSAARVWTNTKWDGTVRSKESDCQSFTSDDSGDMAYGGVRGKTDGMWTDVDVASLCFASNHLYCFSVIP